MILVKKETENWLKIATNDLKVAQALLKEELYLNVIEHSHAALEKLLKGLIVEQKDIQPPKIHDLLKLTTLALIENLQDDMKNTLDELNDLYLSTRYSGDFDKLVKVLHKEKVEKLFNKSKEVFKWMQKKIS